MLRRIVIIGIVLATLIGNVNALGITDVVFGQVEQGKTYNQTAIVITSSAGFDNHFVMEKGGNLADWITVSPIEFDLKAGDNKNITVTLSVPEGAKLGEYTGTLRAVGQKTAPIGGDSPGGTGVGYTIATESNMLTRVVKPSAIEAVSILNILAPKRVKPDDVAKFDVSIKNTGNVPSTVNPALRISKGAETIDTLKGAPIELAVNDEDTVKLYWDTKGVLEGTYTAVVDFMIPSAVNPGEHITTSSDPIRIRVGGSPLPGVAVAAILAAVIVILAAVVLLRRRRKE
jgi:hypothetical protein